MNSSAIPTVAIPHLAPYVPEPTAPAIARQITKQATSAAEGNPIIRLPYRPVKLDELTREQQKRGPVADRADHADQRIHPVKTPHDRELETTELETETARSRFNFAVSDLVNAILDRFPLAAPAILLFVGTDHNAQIDATCAAVAAQLAGRNIGDVLLVDSNEVSELTHDQGLTGQPGLSDLVNGGTKWESLVTNNESAGLDFLPSGIASWKHWGGLERLRSAAAEMKRQYQFICISGGDATGDSAHAWSGLCDGSYLLVSLKDSNGTVAQSAVAELRTNGARLLGCIVTDADEVIA